MNVIFRYSETTNNFKQEIKEVVSGCDGLKESKKEK